MEPEKKSGIRFLLLAVVAAFVFLFTLAYIGEGQKQGRREAQAKIAETRALVVRWADALNVQRRLDGLFERYVYGTNDVLYGVALPEKDSWGNQLRIRYSVNEYDMRFPARETLVVRSSGPDENPYTGDDVFETRLALKRPEPEK